MQLAWVRTVLTTLTLFSAILGLDAKSHELTVEIDYPILSEGGEPINVNALRERLRTFDRSLQDSSSDWIINVQDVMYQTVPTLVDSCGLGEKFPDLDYRRTLSYQERNALRFCMDNIFALADTALGFSAPGFYRRFSDEFLDLRIDLAHKCGFNTVERFSYFSLNAWLIDFDGLKDNIIFCAEKKRNLRGDVRFLAEWHFYIKSQGLLFLFFVFGNWEDAQRYVAYRNLVDENSRRAICVYLRDDFAEDDPLREHLLDEYRCRFKN